MPRTLPQAFGFLLGLWIAIALSPLIVKTAAGETPSESESLARSLHEAVNRVRAEHHLIPLERHGDLDAVAAAHSRDMAQRSYFSHVSPEGLNPVDRIETAGIEAMTLAAENLGSTDQHPPTSRIVEEWLRSPEHRRNLLAAAMNTTGIGIVRGPRGEWLYTQVYVSIPRR